MAEVFPTKSAIQGEAPAWQTDDHVDLNSRQDNKIVRINSRNYLQASGDTIGFQSKPRQHASKTANEVIGGQISAQLSSGVALAGLSGAITGLHVDCYLRGTAAGTIGADVRGLQIELVTDDSGTRTIDGYVAGIRIRSVFSATTITGNFVPIRIEKPEAQTNSKTYDAVFELTDTVPLVWNDDPATEVDGSAQGYFKVIINGAARYVRTYAIGSLAD